jgi:hypothetical protein
MTRIVWGLVFMAAVASRADAGASDYFTEAGKDFGTTPRGPILTHYFIVKNTTNQNVTIGPARVSCGCVSAQVLKSTLAPGETTAVFAAMDTRRIPQAYVTKTVTVYVPFYAPVMEEVQLKVTAFARDDLVMTPDTLAFGTVRQGKGGTTSVKVTLYNNSTWQMSEPTSTGQFIKAEVKQAGKAGNESTFEVTATLDPACPAGNWTAEVWVKTNMAGMEKFRIPVTVNVTTPISISPEGVNMKDLTVGKETEHKIVLNGAQAFKILQVKGVDDVVSVKAGSEEARPTHILTISIKPSKAGGIDKLLEVETDNKEMPKLSIPVKGAAK